MSGKGADRPSDRIDQLERQIAALTQQVASLSVRDPEPPTHRFRWMLGYRRPGSPGVWDDRIEYSAVNYPPTVANALPGAIEGYRSATGQEVGATGRTLMYTGVHRSGAEIGVTPHGMPMIHVRDSNGNTWTMPHPIVQRCHLCTAVDDWSYSGDNHYLRHGHDTFAATWATQNPAGDSDSFTVRVPCSPGQNANVYAGDEVRFMFGDGGNAWALGGQDDAVNTIKIWQYPTQIPRGWEHHDDSDGKFIRGNASGGGSTFGTTGTDYEYYQMHYIIRIAPA